MGFDPLLAAARLESRRRWLRLGPIGLSTPVLADLLARRAAAGAAPAGFGRAKACILLFQVGGPYQCDTFDPKPGAPEEIRGPYAPIDTSAPGVRFTEALPKLARQADALAVVRTVHHTIRCHNPAIYCSLVGREATDPMAVSNRTNAKRTDHPHYASVVSRVRPTTSTMPAHVIIPDVVYNGPAKSPGLTAGYLGASHDPFILGADPGEPDFRVEAVGLPRDMESARLRGRASLLSQLDAEQRSLEETGAIDAMNAFHARAFSMLTSPRAKEAFNLEREPPSVRDRYGRHPMGQGALLARRLIESGVPFVTAFSHTRVEKDSWDTHNKHNEFSKTHLLPPADQSFAALLEDLRERGLLDETLVLWMGEFGRTPRMGVTVSNNTNNVGGRDHWCNCYSVALAGGGVRGGQTIGSSDRMGAYPADRPTPIGDLAATIFHALGIDPHQEIHDIQGVPRVIATGEVIRELF